MKDYWIGVYGKLFHEAFISIDSCRAPNIETAGIIVLAPYLALETNWPVYGWEGQNGKNTIRAGSKAYFEDIEPLVESLKSEFTNAKLVLVDMNPFYDKIPLYALEDPRLIWAKLNSLTGIIRSQDFSMPPPPTSSCEDGKWFEQPLAEKSHFVSFIGNLDSHPIRSKAAQLFHNPPRIIIEGRNASFLDILRDTVFALVLRGDTEFSYRFGEAICSGGIPVLVTDRWAPPFDTLHQFNSYGVLIDESKLSDLLAVLNSLSDSEIQRKRAAAQAICKDHMNGVWQHAQLLGTFLTN